MFDVNWYKLIRTFTFWALRKTKFLAFVQVLFSGIRTIHTNFLAYKDAVFEVLKWNSQIIYLTALLNNKWDNINRGIYIENTANVKRIILWNEIELRPPVYFYNEYDPAVNYDAGEFAAYGDSIWKTLIPTTGIMPVEGVNWTLHKKRDYLKNESEYIPSYDFIVWVPVAVVFDVNQMKALINTYKLAGKIYSIQTY